MAIKAQGTTVHISAENADTTPIGSATFIKIGEVSTVGEPSGEAADIETTNLESEAKEFLTGLPDNGNIGIGGFFVADDAGQEELIEAQDAQERRWLRINWSNGSIWSIKVLVKKYAISAAVDGAVPFSGSFRTSGGWTRV